MPQECEKLHADVAAAIIAVVPKNSRKRVRDALCAWGGLIQNQKVELSVNEVLLLYGQVEILYSLTGVGLGTIDHVMEVIAYLKKKDSSKTP